MSVSLHAESIKAMERAADALENARYNLQGDFTLGAADRAYYACYYCIAAMLYTKNVYPKTHQGAGAKFAELFIKTGIFSVEASDTIAILFNFRQEADYDLDADITIDEARNIIQRATAFYDRCNDYLQKLIASLK